MPANTGNVEASTKVADYLLGIDNGATVTKAVVFDLAGRAVGAASQKAAVEFPQPGWTERALEALWQETAGVIAHAIEAAGIRPGEILAIGACGHGNGLYLLDRAGAPLRPGILSMDTRAEAVVDAWRAAGVLDAVWPRILQTPYAGQAPALLRWLKLHEPAVYTQIGAALPIKDFVKHRLTGALSGDPTDMSAAGLLELSSGDYAPELLELFGIPEVAGALPPLVESGAVAGRVTPAAARATGLLAGTPVVGGMFDATAGPLGAGAIKRGQVCVTAGTWGVNALVAGAPPDRDRQLFSAIYPPGGWLAIDASPTSSANLEWFVTELCAEERAEAQERGVSVFEVCGEAIARRPAAGTSLIYHPFLYGAGGQPSARAGFYGLAGWHTRADMLRALYEGVVYGHLGQLERLLAGQPHPSAARLIGGGARSPVWAQMFADVLDLTIEVPSGQEIGARGAALCAGVGSGAYAGYADAVARAVAIERTYAPDPAATARYRAAYAEFRRIAEAMREPWEHLRQLEMTR
jgi:L-xylulokinase